MTSNISLLEFIGKWFSFDGVNYYPKPKVENKYWDVLKVRDFKKQKRYKPEQIIELYEKNSSTIDK